MLRRAAMPLLVQPRALYAAAEAAAAEATAAAWQPAGAAALASARQQQRQQYRRPAAALLARLGQQQQQQQAQRLFGGFVAPRSSAASFSSAGAAQRRWLASSSGSSNSANGSSSGSSNGAVTTTSSSGGGVSGFEPTAAAKEAVERTVVVNTLDMARRFEAAGLARAQAEALTEHITTAVVLDRVRLSEKFVARADLEKVLVEQDARVGSLKAELVQKQEAHLATLHKDLERQQNFLEKMRSETRHEIDKLTASQRLDLNLEKGCASASGRVGGQERRSSSRGAAGRGVGEEQRTAD